MDHFDEHSHALVHLAYRQTRSEWHSLYNGKEQVIREAMMQLGHD